MIVDRLRLEHFRCFQRAEVHFAPGFNLITGDNGSGKTSVLEALHLMAHGRSFRGRVRDGLIRRGQTALDVIVDWHADEDLPHRAGLRHFGGQWQARLDGQDVQQLGQLVSALAIISFEPGSHALIDGASELRRRFLDWGLFHVEQDFMPSWRRYTRAQKQRNALLRQRVPVRQLEAWEFELAAHGEAITRLRDAHVANLQPYLDRRMATLLPELGTAKLRLFAGWKTSDFSLGDALLLARERDLALGHTTVGPHRADLKIGLEGVPAENLSRGQTKQLALAMMLAQAELLADSFGHWPVLQLDDLGAELDRSHQERTVAALAGSGAQVMITGTETPAALVGSTIPVSTFHVEHGDSCRVA